MKGEDDLKRDIDRANSVKSVVSNAEYQNAFLTIKAHLINQFESLGYKQKDDMIEIHRKLQSMNWFEKELENVMNTGKMSEQTLLQRLKIKK